MRRRLETSREAVALGLSVRDLRLTLGWTQRELGRRGGVSQSTISAVERGRRGDLSLVALLRVIEAMGARLTWSVDAPYFGDRLHQRDPAHARCEAFVASRLERVGWRTATETEVGGDRSRGWIDVLAWHEATGVLLVIELKTELRDLGAIERQLGWYEREAWRAARRLAWRPRVVASVLLLLATRAVDDRLAENRAAILVGFPGRATALTQVVSGGTILAPGRPARFVALIDPLSRRTSWLRSLRLDGRNTPAPYVDYADFMRRWRRPPQRPPGRPSEGRAGRRPGPVRPPASP